MKDGNSVRQKREDRGVVRRTQRSAKEGTQEFVAIADFYYEQRTQRYTLRVLFLDFLSSVRNAISLPLVDKFVRNLVDIRFDPFYEAFENFSQVCPPEANNWQV